MPYDDRLFALLRGLDDEELRHIWVDCLKQCPEQKVFAQSSHEERVVWVSRVWRTEHGSFVRNVMRGEHEFPWKQILIDVADKLRPGLGWTPYKLNDAHSETELERVVLDLYDERLGEDWPQLTPEQQRQALHGRNPKSDKNWFSAAIGTVLPHDKSMAATLTLLTVYERRCWVASVQSQVRGSSSCST